MANKEETTLTPSALVNIFSNALSADATRKVFIIKGQYVPGRGMNYNGFYFDSLKDEIQRRSITADRSGTTQGKTWQAQQVIECSAYLIKKVQANGARIELQFTFLLGVHFR